MKPVTEDPLKLPTIAAKAFELGGKN